VDPVPGIIADRLRYVEWSVCHLAWRVFKRDNPLVFPFAQGSHHLRTATERVALVWTATLSLLLAVAGFFNAAPGGGADDSTDIVLIEFGFEVFGDVEAAVTVLLASPAWAPTHPLVALQTDALFMSDALLLAQAFDDLRLPLPAGLLDVISASCTGGADCAELNRIFALGECTRAESLGHAVLREFAEVNRNPSASCFAHVLELLAQDVTLLTAPGVAGEALLLTEVLQLLDDFALSLPVSPLPLTYADPLPVISTCSTSACLADVGHLLRLLSFLTDTSGVPAYPLAHLCLTPR